MGEIQAHNFCQETIKLKEEIEQRFLELGARLHKIQEQKLYEPYWDSWSEYVMELDISVTKASRLKNIWYTFVEEHGMDETQLLRAGGWSNLAEIKDVVETKEEAEEWIEKADRLNREDLRTEVRVAKGEKDPAECEHVDTYKIRVCRDCNQRVRVDG